MTPESASAGSGVSPFRGQRLPVGDALRALSVTIVPVP